MVRQQGDAPPKLVEESAPLPAPGARQLLVRVTHAAQNPTDGILYHNPPPFPKKPANQPVQSFDSNAFGDGAVLGCDFVGTVEAKGPGSYAVAVGTTVAGLIWGGEYPGYAQVRMISF